MKAIQKLKAQFNFCMKQMLEVAKKGKMGCKLSTYRDVIELLIDGGLKIRQMDSLDDFSVKESHEVFVSWKSGKGRLGSRLMGEVRHYQSNQNSKARVVNRRSARKGKEKSTMLDPEWMTSYEGDEYSLLSRECS